MTPTRSHIAAAVLLTIGGVLVGVAAIAVALAGADVQARIATQPAGTRLLEDPGALLPFIAAFAVVDLATVVGLVRGRSWAVVSASVTALGAAAMGALGLAIALLGNDPSPITGWARASGTDGLAIIATFTSLYVSALLALRVDGLPSARRLPALA